MNKDLTARKNRGRVNIRCNQSRGTARLRFTNVHPDQQQTILSALALARSEAGTDYDAVALDAICQHFLATYSPRRGPLHPGE